MLRAISHPRFDRALDELSPASDRVWLLGLTTGLGFTLIAAYPFAHTASGVFWAYAGFLIRGGLYLWAGDALRGRGGDTIETVFRFGLVAGLLEILVDWGLIHWVPTGRLVYLTGNDVVLLGSPIWMPLAWACVIVELGYPALRGYGILRRRISARPRRSPCRWRSVCCRAHRRFLRILRLSRWLVEVRDGARHGRRLLRPLHSRGRGAHVPDGDSRSPRTPWRTRNSDSARCWRAARCSPWRSPSDTRSPT